jgi:hypothetical protein
MQPKVAVKSHTFLIDPHQNLVVTQKLASKSNRRLSISGPSQEQISTRLKDMKMMSLCGHPDSSGFGAWLKGGFVGREKSQKADASGVLPKDIS